MHPHPDAALLLAWLLPVIRLFAALGPGYIHPDEIFQSQEVMASAVFRYEAVIPWEFAACAAPARSLIPPLLSVGIPYWLLRLGALWWPAFRDSRLLVLAPRVWLWCFSLGVYWIITRATATHGETRDAARKRSPSSARLYDVSLAPVLFSTSWVSLVMMTRPFSNTLEAWLLLLFIFAHQALDWHQSEARTRTMVGAMGALAAFGVWTRFTFVIFCAPVCLSIVVDAVLATRHSPQHPERCPRTVQFIIGALATGLCAFVATAVLLASVDALLFGALRIDWVGWGLGNGVPLRVHGHLVWPPLTNLMYNLDAGNLAKHGTHPHWLHALGNMPLMFGPAAIAIAGAAAVGIVRAVHDLCQLLLRFVEPWRVLVHSRQSSLGGRALPSFAEPADATLNDDTKEKDGLRASPGLRRRRRGRSGGRSMQNSGVASSLPPPPQSTDSTEAAAVAAISEEGLLSSAPLSRDSVVSALSSLVHHVCSLLAPELGCALCPDPKQTPSRRLFVVSRNVLLVGLAGLSSASHQEARFLAPLLFPVCVIVSVLANDLLLTPSPSRTTITHSAPVFKRRAAAAVACAWIAWGVFNAALGVFFGFVHQAGVLPSVCAIGNTLHPPASSASVPDSVSVSSSAQHCCSRPSLNDNTVSHSMCGLSDSSSGSGGGVGMDACGSLTSRFTATWWYGPDCLCLPGSPEWLKQRHCTAKLPGSASFAETPSTGSVTLADTLSSMSFVDTYMIPRSMLRFTQSGAGSDSSNEGFLPMPWCRGDHHHHPQQQHDAARPPLSLSSSSSSSSSSSEGLNIVDFGTLESDADRMSALDAAADCLRSRNGSVALVLFPAPSSSTEDTHETETRVATRSFVRTVCGGVAAATVAAPEATGGTTATGDGGQHQHGDDDHDAISAGLSSTMLRFYYWPHVSTESMPRWGSACFLTPFTTHSGSGNDIHRSGNDMDDDEEGERSWGRRCWAQIRRFVSEFRLLGCAAGVSRA